MTWTWPNLKLYFGGHFGHYEFETASLLIPSTSREEALEDY